MTAASAVDYFDYGPVDEARYNKSRAGFDGVLGFFDGLSGVTNSLSRTVGSVTDISDDINDARANYDRVLLDRAEREQDIALDAFKIERGDNLKLYFAVGAVALVAVVILGR